MTNENPELLAAIETQIRLLNEGLPLEALDASFAPDGVMYANDDLFGADAAEARRKQEPFIAQAVSIEGRITDLCIHPEEPLCVFRNRTSFSTSSKVQQINGLVWQRWARGKVVEERYYDGEAMASWIERGLLQDPTLLDSFHPDKLAANVRCSVSQLPGR